MRILLFVTFLLVLSTCICSAAETRTRTGLSDTRAVPALSKTDVLHLAEQKAKLEHPDETITLPGARLMNRDVIKATPTNRLRAVAALLLAFVIAVGLKHLLPQKVAGMILPAAWLGASLYFVQLGRKLLRAGQFPLPNAWVMRDTPVQRGKPVIIRAYAFIVGGCFMSLLSGALLLFLSVHA